MKIIRDIRVVTGITVTTNDAYRRERRWWTAAQWSEFAFLVLLPSILTDSIAALDWLSDRQPHQSPLSPIPAFVFLQRTPLSVLREFIAGHFGGDGASACCLQVQQHRVASPLRLQLRWTRRRRARRRRGGGDCSTRSSVLPTPRDFTTSRTGKSFRSQWHSTERISSIETTAQSLTDVTQQLVACPSAAGRGSDALVTPTSLSSSLPSSYRANTDNVACVHTGAGRG